MACATLAIAIGRAIGAGTAITMIVSAATMMVSIVTGTVTAVIGAAPRSIRKTRGRIDAEVANVSAQGV